MTYCDGCNRKFDHLPKYASYRLCDNCLLEAVTEYVEEHQRQDAAYCASCCHNVGSCDLGRTPEECR